MEKVKHVSFDSSQKKTSSKNTVKVAEARTTARTGAQKSAEQVKQANAHSGMEMLIALEKSVREVESVKELNFLMANETRRFTGARQVFVLEGKAKQYKVKSVSSVSSVDRNNPLIISMENMVKRLMKDVDCAQPRRFSVSAYLTEADNVDTYPFSELLWVPLKTRKGQIFGGMILARERVWVENEETITTRLAEVYSYAWQALIGPGKLESRLNSNRTLKVTLALGLMFLAGFLPVKLDVLAPAEIVAEKPFIVAAPVDGVIEKIQVAPNSPVKKGDPLFRFVDTQLFNDYQLAKRAVTVAEARYKKSMQASFSDIKARHDLAMAKTELQLKLAERDYARDKFDKTVVKAPEAGIAVFHSKDEWTGKPVTTGQKVMTIAKSDQAMLRAEVPVADAIALKNGADVKVFLDANPLRPFYGKVTYASYQARPTPDNQLAYVVLGKLDKKDGQKLRIGLRGTAQIYGEKSNLYFYLFRKPLAAFRQMTGL